VASISVITGFALYGQSNPGGFIYIMTNWIGALVGGMPIARFIHHVATWIFLAFIPIHVYLSIRADLLERTGVISSIISGGRFVPSGHKFVDE
jgi:Ni,Fe-hydrogenase I cytochrome b subunit